VSKIQPDSNFYIISLLTLMAILGGTIYNPALPSIANFFHISSEKVSLVSTLFQLPVAIVTPIFGVLADSFGRKQVLVPSLVVFALGGVLSGLAPSFDKLIEWRFFQGIGTASLESLQLTIISDLYTGKKLASVMGFVAGLNGMSSAIFPLIGGILASFSWRFPFLTSLLAIPVTLMVLTTLKLPKQEYRVQDFRLKSYLKNTWGSINNRQVGGLLFAVMSMFMLQVGACLTYVPIFAGKQLGASGPVIGVILTSLSLSLALVASQLGLLMRYFSQTQLIKIAFILSAVGLLIIPTVHNVWLLFIPIFFLGVAQGMAFPSTQTMLATFSAQESRAGFMGVNSMIQGWGQTLGPFLSSIVDGIWGTHTVFYAGAVFSLVSFVIFSALMTSKH
jgi:MFS family permease